MDYLSRVPNFIRVLSIIILLCFSPFLFLLGISMFLMPMPPEERVGATWVGLFLFFLGIMTVWVALRLRQSSAPANRITLLPLWLIRIFGALFIIMTIFRCLVEQNFLFLSQTMGAGLAMVMIDSHIRRKRLEEAERGRMLDNKSKGVSESGK